MALGYERIVSFNKLTVDLDIDTTVRYKRGTAEIVKQANTGICLGLSVHWAAKSIQKAAQL